MNKMSLYALMVIAISSIGILDGCVVKNISKMAEGFNHEIVSRNNALNPIFLKFDIVGVVVKTKPKPEPFMELKTDSLDELLAEVKFSGTNIFKFGNNSLIVYQPFDPTIKAGDKVCKESGSYVFHRC